MADGEHVREELIAALHEVSEHAFESELRGCVLHFPSDCWQNARDAGLKFDEVLHKVDAHVFAVLDALIEHARLTGLRISSLYRATGGGPHTTGRGIDITAITQGGDPWVRFLRETDEAEEPALAGQVRKWLWQHRLVSQVLGPWFMCSSGRGVVPNRARSPLEKQHRNHLHLTVKP
jgi:hypothetical protein